MTDLPGQPCAIEHTTLQAAFDRKKPFG